MIPLRIFRTWMSSSLPAVFRWAWNATARDNPGINQILYTDRDMDMFMKKHYSNKPPWGNAVWAAYNRINRVYGAARADLFRYALIYERGGIYLDIKSSARNLSNAIRPDDEMIISPWRMTSVVRLWSQLHLLRLSGEYQQWWIASRAGHPALRAVLNHTVNAIRGHATRSSDQEACQRVRNLLGDSLILYLVPSCRGSDILWTTGPFAFSLAIDDFLREGRPRRRSTIRVLGPDGDGTFDYDALGQHRQFARPYFALGYPLVVD